MLASPFRQWRHLVTAVFVTCGGLITLSLYLNLRPPKSSLLQDDWNLRNGSGLPREFQVSSNVFKHGILQNSVPDVQIRDCVTDVEIRVTKSHKVTFFYPSLSWHGIPKESPSHRLEMFSQIFKKRVWNIGMQEVEGYSDIQSSGLGSTPFNTRETVQILDHVVAKVKQELNISRISLLDLPCGDMVWMNRYLDNRSDIDYVGMDIVPALINRHRSKYAHWKFFQHDIVDLPLSNSFDVILSRQMTQHLTNHDTIRALKHFSESGSKYLLITDYPSSDYNGEILTDKLDRHRRQNLLLPPFQLTPPVCAGHDGRLGGWLSLWKLPLLQVPLCLDEKYGERIRNVSYSGHRFIFCV